MFDLKTVKNEIKLLKKDVSKNYDKLLNIYLRLIIEYLYIKKTNEYV